ncbi:MAG TPA: 16S rRNA (guanine(966)-N(2))-methyltransferase RsmD [Opitutae bacterium]|nr:16S rRNA (guanine(966)-N(2))-methyltransferase RsmD [Opitutae bacterium]
MRITGGRARGIKLKVPTEIITRPATDRMREAVFSSLGPSVQNCQVLDLFAGTGSYGLEALSRGAAGVCFVENNRAAIKCLKINTAAVTRSCDLKKEVTRIVAQDVYSSQANLQKYDLLFIDPPYASIASNIGRIFTTVINNCSAKTTRAILEVPADLELQIEGWEPIRRIGKPGKGKPNVVIFSPTS